MRFKGLIIILLLILSSNGIYSQNEDGVQLPSEETGKELENMRRGPSLRYGPGGSDEDGNAQGEVPVGDASNGILITFIILSSAYIGLNIYKSKKEER
ncbi:MAG: hypothetical protein ACK5MK_13980 [Dysgonomonas sp.]